MQYLSFLSDKSEADEKEDNYQEKLRKRKYA